MVINIVLICMAKGEIRLALCTIHICVQPWLSDLLVDQRPSLQLKLVTMAQKPELLWCFRHIRCTRDTQPLVVGA